MRLVPACLLAVLVIGHESPWTGQAAHESVVTGRLTSCEVGQSEVALELSSADGIVRLRISFFDRQSATQSLAAETAEYWNCLTASMLLANHNRMDGGKRTLWMRDRLSRALDTYSSRERAQTMIRRFGDSGLRETVDPLGKVYATHANEVGLVRGLPYRPADARSAPFVGSWPSFATEVYVERPGGLVKVY